MSPESSLEAETQDVFVFPASFAQTRLWFLNQLAPGNPFYNVSAAVRLTGNLNIAALEETFNEIVRRHETLRTTFEMVDGQLNQLIALECDINLPVVDLRSLPIGEREEAAKHRAIAVAQHSFNLTTGPLFKVELLQLEATDYILLLNLHHIVADGWSMGVLIRELGAIYTAFYLGKPSPLPELSIQYADFAHAQREWSGEMLETQLSYWQQQLANLPALNLPTARPRPSVQSYQGATQPLELPQLTKSLALLSQHSGVTLFMTLLAAFVTLLYRYTGETDIAVGSPIANRNRSEIEPLIGFFINSLVLRIDLSGNPTFQELLERVRGVALAAYAHQDLPFEKLVQELHPERDLSRHPLFQVAIALQNTPIEALLLPELALSQFEFDSGTARLDLEFNFWEAPEGLKGQVTYSTQLFDQSTIIQMLEHFQILLEGIVRNPSQRIAELPMLTAREQRQILVEWNQTQQDYPIDKCFHQLFESQAQLTPDAIALVYEDKQLTYQELNFRSNQLAHYLQKLGVAPEIPVGICVDRSLEMIVGVLGILKAGGAYVPIPPYNPPQRIKYILEDAQLSILLTEKERLGENSVETVVCLKNWEAIATESQENPTSGVTTANLAYIIYTSGSTGKPKGVLIEHRGLCNLAEAQIQAFNVKPGDRVLQFASLSFDASIFEIVMALRVGATLHLASRERLVGSALVELLQDQAITHATLPPAVLMTMPTIKLPALKVLISAGEACSQKIVSWQHGRRFFNAYGLTETTVWSTLAEVSDKSKKPSLGRAIANTEIYVLDAHLQPVPIGIPGELYIGGVAIARGYLNLPELTAERFKNHPKFNRLYKTGDLVRREPDGNLEFLGRSDNQVKIRGYRVELGEVEAILSQHPSVREVAVIARENGDNKQLVAHIVLTSEPPTTALRQFLKEKLPDYMIPSAFVMRSSLPLTLNGKVDRNLLQHSSTASNSQANSFIAPRTLTEIALAKIWAQLLNLDRVGIHDNFFELGGDSLLAIRLLERVHQQFEQKLPLSDLFLAPTVEQLALILNEGMNQLWSPLVPLQPRGSKPALFCVHPIFGVVLPYYELARHLGDRPFYALQPFGLDGEQSPLTRVEDMATRYIEALRKVQPQGPYQLCGWSFGGLVAFEMATQLQKAGQQVSFLALLDTLAPISSNQPSFIDSCKFLLTTVSRSIYPFFMDYWSLMMAQPQEKQRSLIHSIFQRLKNPHAWRFSLERATITNLIPQEARLRLLDELTFHRIARVFYANSRAALKYLPNAYPSKITLFKTLESSQRSEDSTLGWSELAAGVEVNQISGNHLTMLRMPHVQILAEKLQGCLDYEASK